MSLPSPKILALYQTAISYQESGDTYNAVKLLKYIIRQEPEWSEPYFRLGEIYKNRKEWKPVLHYHKKTIALDTSNKEAWWNVGIAATALKKWRIAKHVWNKFGVQTKRNAPVSVRLQYNNRFEILWVTPIDPVRGIVNSIPFPKSGNRFGDILLLDRTPSGHHVLKNKKVPVFDCLGLFKRSVYRTYSCWVSTVDGEKLSQLDSLCTTAGLGFENWSNAHRMYAPQLTSQLPEYFGPEFIPQATDRAFTHVAIAAKNGKDVEEVLGNWNLITLEMFSALTCHY